MTSLLLVMAVVSADFYVEDYRAKYVGDYETITAAINAAAPGDNIHFDGSRVYSPVKRIELYGETALGHGTTIRRPDEWNVTLTQPANIGDTVIHVDAVPPEIVFRNHLTLVEFNAGGAFPYRDGMEKGGKFVQSWDAAARTIEFQTPITEAFPAGSSVFRVDNLMTTFGGGSADNFIFDGNRANNDSHISWIYGHSFMSWTGNGSLTNSIFKNQPGQAVYIYSGSNFQVEGNLFHDMNSSAMHFSSTNQGTGTVDFRNNVIVRSNEQADRVGHSEGVVTISLLNDRIRIEDNLAIDVDKPFIGNFGPTMNDWEVSGNKLYDVNGLAFGRFHWTGQDLANFVFTDNYCQDCNLTEFQGGTRDGIFNQWQNLHFLNNTIVDGTLAMDEVAIGSIDGLAISSCDPSPVTITDSAVSVSDVATSLACDLSHDDVAELIYNPLTGEMSLDLAGTPHGEISEAFMVLADGTMLSFSESEFISPGLDASTDILVARWTDSVGSYGNFRISEVAVPEPTTLWLVATALLAWAIAKRSGAS